MLAQPLAHRGVQLLVCRAAGRAGPLPLRRRRPGGAAVAVAVAVQHPSARLGLCDHDAGGSIVIATCRWHGPTIGVQPVALAVQPICFAMATVLGGGVCTASDATRWYSYRRDARPGTDTGRLATVVWQERVTL
jgi:hypothetical protein